MEYGKKEKYEIEFKNYTNRSKETVEANELHMDEGFLFFNHRKAHDDVTVQLMICAGDILLVKKQ